MAWTETTQAVAAAIGAIATPAAVLIGVRQLRWQQDQHAQQQALAQLEQPRNVVLETQVRDWPTVDGQDVYRTVVATVTNLGKETVYDAALQWRYGPTEEVGGVDAKGVLLPGEKWEQPAPTSVLHLAPFEQIGGFVTFFDGDSRGWAKTQRGRLARLREAVDEGW